MAGKQWSIRRRSTSTTAPTAPRAMSSHMNQNRSWPGVPNRYSTIWSSTDRRPKSRATVVVVLSARRVRSSTPTDRPVIAASVVSGVISETAPTNVVFPTPNPPATTTLTGIGGRASTGPESTEEPLEDGAVGALGARQVDGEGAHRREVRHEHAGDTER